MLDLMGTIKKQANSNATLSGRVDSDIWFEIAPPDTRMPYVTYHIITDSPLRCFSAADDMREVLVQFSIFDENSHVVPEQIASDLAIVFDRKEVLYSTDTHVSCERMAAGFGPIRLEDCWQKVVDYRFRFEEN